MDRKITECLNNSYDNYILPFLWLHGEPKERVRKEILAIKNSGINEFCAESRPYESFCKEQWWDDFGFILETASELGMRVWLLDDQKFPTGYANGYLERPENAHLRKRLIREVQIDVVGPMKGAKLFVGGRVSPEEKIIKVVAYRRTGKGEELEYSSARDLTDTVCDGMAYWDIPDGIWRVCVVIETAPYDYKDDRLFYYIDMLNPDSCHAMIDAIYQPHYEHFSKYFGNTFAGFFSDEPAFLNVCYTYHNTLGVMFSPYPWRSDLAELVEGESYFDKDKFMLYLPALWENLGEMTSSIRALYMDTITKQYRDNFSNMLGGWCREHGVMYIGHVIEDMGAHTRMGYGSGHYFRALEGQDMAGIDIVLMQDIPGITEKIHRAPLADGGVADPAFFRYTLPKLASSHSHIQPLKKGRAMCELFGAFGWAEGLPFMKGLADVMLASGINHFVPHAFSPKEEDPDCPPHFYNGGKNIQYPYFKELMAYMSRCSHMLSDGKHKADVAVFYNAEGEWTGGKNEPFYEICRTLTKNQIDFDIVPLDALSGATVIDKRLYINNESYGALVISETELLPEKCLEEFKYLSNYHLPIIFINSLPRLDFYLNDKYTNYTPFLDLSLDELISFIRMRGFYHVKGKGSGLEHLRFYHVTRNEREIYLFSNESLHDRINATISLKEQGECLIYEPWENKCYRSSAENGSLTLDLEGGNMLFVIFGEEIPSDIPEFKAEADRANLSMLFDIAIKEEGQSEFCTIATESECFDISAPEHFPEFSGQIRYRATFDGISEYTVLDLGQVGEIAQAWLNGVYLGLRINAPYKFSMTSALKPGKNELEIINP